MVDPCDDGRMDLPPRPPPTASQDAANQIFDSADAEREQIIAARVVLPPAIGRARTVRVALLIAVPVLVAVLLVNFAWQPLVSFFEPWPAPAIARDQAQTMLDGIVVDIEAFRKDYDHLPGTLIEVGVPPRGRWSYAGVSNTHYRVQGTLYGQSVSFDSSAPKARRQ
jgi:hypothetical protein